MRVSNTTVHYQLEWKHFKARPTSYHYCSSPLYLCVSISIIFGPTILSFHGFNLLSNLKKYPNIVKGNKDKVIGLCLKLPLASVPLRRRDITVPRGTLFWPCHDNLTGTALWKNYFLSLRGLQAHDLSQYEMKCFALGHSRIGWLTENVNHCLESFSSSFVSNNSTLELQFCPEG